MEGLGNTSDLKMLNHWSLEPGGVCSRVDGTEGLLHGRKERGSKCPGDTRKNRDRWLGSSRWKGRSGSGNYPQPTNPPLQGSADFFRNGPEVMSRDSVSQATVTTLVESKATSSTHCRILQMNKDQTWWGAPTLIGLTDGGCQP